MNAVAQGFWFSGQNLAPHAVMLASDGSQLHVRGLDAPVSVPLRDVRVSDRLGTTARFLHLPGGVTFETLDNDIVDAWLAQQERGRGAAVIHWLEQRSRVAAGATVLLVASVVALVTFGLPWAARKAAFAVPEKIEREAGKAGLVALQPLLGESQLGLNERQRAIAQMERIVRARGFTQQPQLEFRSMGKFPNAFALPGGFIVVSDELLRLATDDELAAVLAHETAHWQLRHGMQSVFRNSAALLVVSTVTGDLSTLTTFASTLPLLLLQRGYSRSFEEAADAYAVETLRQANIDARYLATILTKLERARPAAGADYSYLSTHPSTDDRARKIDPTGSYSSLIPDERARAIVTDAQGGLSVVESVDVVPRAVHQTPPVYPLLMHAAKIQGTVTVEFIVAKDGSVREPRIVRSTQSAFEQPVLDAIATWKFEPGRRRGELVNTRAQIDVPFTLSEEDAPTDAAALAQTNIDDLIPPPELSDRAPLNYPAIPLPPGTQAQVRVEVKIAPDGTVASVILKLSTDHRFDALALGNARRWRFVPQPIASETLRYSREIDYLFRASAETATASGTAEARLLPAKGKWSH